MKLATPLLTDCLMLRTPTVADTTEPYLGGMCDPEATRLLESRLVDDAHGSLPEYIASWNESPVSMLLGDLPRGRHPGRQRGE